MNSTLDRPTVADPIVLDETILDDVLMCVLRDNPADWKVGHRCCGHYAFGCTPCTEAWEAQARAAFALNNVVGVILQCSRCGTDQVTFEQSFRIDPI